MKKNILITGANGFLASTIIRLNDAKHSYIGLVRNRSDLYRLEGINQDLTLYNIDKQSLESVFKENTIDIVIHTATKYGTESVELETIESNLFFPLKVLDLAIKYKVSTFVNADTCYTVDYNRLRSYSLSKAQFVDWSKLQSEHIKVINVKIGSIYGPLDSPYKITAMMIERMLNNEPVINLTPGEQRRNFLHIEDAANAFYFILERLNLFSENFTEFKIGTGESTSIKEFIEMIKELTSSTSSLNFGGLEYRENEIMNPSPDISAISSLGWKANYTLRDGLMSTIAAQKSAKTS